MVLGSWKYLIKYGGEGHCVHDMVHSGTDRRENTRVFFCGWWDNQLLRVGERKIFLDVNPDLFHGGGYPEQAKRSCLLTIPWESHV